MGNTLSFTANWGNDARLASRRLYKTSGGVNLSLLTYAYDNDDNITGITDGVDAARSVTFGYDAVGRLTRNDGNFGTTHRYDWVFDKNGNRTREEARDVASQPAPTTFADYALSAGTNRLASVGTGAGQRAIAYDARGIAYERKMHCRVRPRSSILAELA